MKPTRTNQFLILLLAMLLSAILASAQVTKLPLFHFYRGNPSPAIRLIHISVDSLPAPTARLYTYTKTSPLAIALQPVVTRDKHTASIKWAQTTTLPEIAWLQLFSAGSVDRAGWVYTNREVILPVSPSTTFTTGMKNGERVLLKTATGDAYYNLMRQLLTYLHN